jgi:GNAT superfamily N-acetyltransferase
MIANTPTQTAVPTLRRATALDAENVLSALTAAFSIDPVVSGWVFDDRQTYYRYCRTYMTDYVEVALEHGQIWTTGDQVAAIVTMPSTALDRAEAASEDQLRDLYGPHVERVASLHAALDNRHPSVPSHHYCALVAVAPAHQGRGIGLTLMREYLAYLDQRGLPAYIEASNARNSRLYARIGYQHLAEPIVLPGCDTHVFPMWRPARDLEPRTP